MIKPTPFLILVFISSFFIGAFFERKYNVDIPDLSTSSINSFPFKRQIIVEF